MINLIEQIKGVIELQSLIANMEDLHEDQLTNRWMAYPSLNPNKLQPFFVPCKFTGAYEIEREDDDNIIFFNFMIEDCPGMTDTDTQGANFYFKLRSTKVLASELEEAGMDIRPKKDKKTKYSEEFILCYQGMREGNGKKGNEYHAFKILAFVGNKDK